MYDFATLNSDIIVLFGFGTLMLLVGIVRFFKKDEQNKISWLVTGICMFIFFAGFGLADINASKNPEIEIFVGEFIEKKSSGTGANRETNCTFHSHSFNEKGYAKHNFTAADIEYFLIPEKGKWYEIHYVANSNLEAVVNIVEIETPESIEHTEEYDEIIMYTGEFIDKKTYGTGSNESIEYKFDANDGNKPQWFLDEEVEFFIIPEKGKWYEIQYVMKNTYKLVIDINETDQP